MLADRSSCHDIKGFVDKCNRLNGGYLSFIPDCKNQVNKDSCWKRAEVPRAEDTTDLVADIFDCRDRHDKERITE